MTKFLSLLTLTMCIVLTEVGSGLFLAEQPSNQHLAPTSPRHRLSPMTRGQAVPLAQEVIEDGIIYGPISGTLGFNGAGQPNRFIVTQTLEVRAGDILTITGNTELFFFPEQSLIVEGKLVVEGKNPYPTRFGALEGFEDWGWGGIHFTDTATGSLCRGCIIENVSPGEVALQVDAPLTFKRSQIRQMISSTAIASSVPFTMSHVIMDQVGTAWQVTGTTQALHKASHLTLSRCQNGLVNQGSEVLFENSIMVDCQTPVTTLAGGKTTVQYDLFHGHTRLSVTAPQADLTLGPGLVYADPKFVDYPKNVHLLPESPAVDAANPAASYRYEQRFNGGRANMGAYGNTVDATLRVPINQMGVDLTVIDQAAKSGYPGEVITYQLRLENTGTVSDVYWVNLPRTWTSAPVRPSFANRPIYNSEMFTLESQQQQLFTVWAKINPNVFYYQDRIIPISTYNGYIRDELTLNLTILGALFQEQAGQLAIEAEHFSFYTAGPGTEWLTETTIAGYAGNSYVTTRFDAGLQVTALYTNSPSVYYPVNITTTGRYYVWARGYAPNGAGDSAYIQLDDQSAIPFTGFAPRSGWQWSNQGLDQQPVSLDITEPGPHRIFLWMREDGLRLDRIVLTTDATYQPSGDGPPESVRRQ